MAQLKLNTLLLQIKLLLWKNYKLKTRRWKELLLMIGFAVFSMLLLGVFRSDVQTQTTPAYQPQPQPFSAYLQSNSRSISGKMVIINKLSDNIENTQKILLLQLSLQQWFKAHDNNINIITNISSDSQLDHLIQSQQNETSFDATQQIRLAIDMNKFDEHNFDYSIRLPSEWVPSSSDGLIKSDQQTSTAALAESLGVGHSYSNQFIPLQIWLDQFFIHYTKQIKSAPSNAAMAPFSGIKLKSQQFWTKSHKDDPFMDSMGSLLPFYIVSCFLLPFSYMIKDIVEEKSAKIKEGMRTMGLHILSFWISWFLTYLCLISLVASIVILIQWKTSMFLHTSFAVLYVLYLLYGFSIIAFASAMTTFFDKPKTASAVSGFTYFLLQMPAFAIKSRLDAIGLTTKMLFSLSSPTGMFLCLLSIIKLEQNGKGYTFENLFDCNIVPAVQNGYCLGYSMLMLSVDIVIYLAFTWFFDQYIRSEFGQKLSIKQILSQICCCNLCEFKNKYFSSLSPAGNYVPYKPLSKHQRHSVISDDSDILLSPNDIEMNVYALAQNENQSAEIHKNVSIQMINLSKTYNGNGVSSKCVNAVNNLSMNIYESECCALLGHNGAGKTTAINMLTGMIDTTAGTANINGYNINHEMNEIRQFLGVCPQHSLLWPMLTVYEHLYLFANLKNMDKAQIDEEIDLLLHDVGLSEKKKSYSSTLSGGQKRKLSLAIAFIGDPKVIFLDEPTSGMDPVSRRYTWDLIEKYKENRCIVLTTHDMNEADAIADRIGIMAHGKLRIYGSALYLKSVCGVGYNLIFTLHCNVDDIKAHLEQITNKIQQFIKNAVLYNSDNVYADIAKCSDNMNAVSSIEVIFKTSIQDSSKFPALFHYVDSHLAELRVQHYAVSVTTLEEVFLKISGDNDIYSVPKIEPFHDSNISDTLLTAPNEEKHGFEHGNEQLTAEEFKIDRDIIDSLCKFQRPHLSSYQRCRIHIGTVIQKRFRVSIRDLRGILTQCIMPLISLLFGLSLIKSFGTNTVSTAQPILHITTTAYQSPFIMPYNDINSTSTSIISTFSNDIDSINVNDISLYNDLNHWIANKTYKQQPYDIDAIYAALYVDANDNSLTFLYDDKATHLLPALVNQWNQAILNKIRGDTASTLSVSSHPFALASSDIEMIDFGVTLMIIILISLSYAFIPTSFASHIVRERESKVKHQQIIAGLGLLCYWIANLLFDLMVFMIPCLIGGVVILLFDVKIFTFNLNLLAVVLIFVLFGFSVITLTYLLSFLFKNAQSAQTILGRMYEISGLMFLIIGILMAQFIPYGTYIWCDLLLFLFRLFPNYAFGEGLFNLAYAQQQQSSIMAQFSRKKEAINVFSWNILGRDLCFMFFTTLSNLMLISLIEYITSSAKLMSYFDYNYAEDSDANTTERDTDILLEKECILSGEKHDNSGIEIVGLRKVFKSKKNNNVPNTAVNDLYFSVGEGEIFAFLGSNGAGKSTTIKMLTRELFASSGTAYLHSINICDDKLFRRANCGYCAQNDGLIELLTGREHLELYCRLRGFDRPDTKTFVSIIINCLNLNEFADGAVNKYSGGNRRKLCVGIALIGNPCIVLLDEPSTGIDPISRRFMWDFIHNVTRNEMLIQKRCVLLTSHSMEEAENLCDRIGIMDRGNLQCLGTAQHLKTKYGDGYELYVKLKDNLHIERKNELKQYVLQLESECGAHIKLMEDRNVSLRFSIIGNENDIPLGKVFEAIENVKQKYQIIQYSVSQNTLEQVFLHLVSEEQEDDDEDANANQSNCRLCCS